MTTEADELEWIDVVFPTLTTSPNGDPALIAGEARIEDQNWSGGPSKTAEAEKTDDAIPAYQKRSRNSGAAEIAVPPQTVARIPNAASPLLKILSGMTEKAINFGFW